METVALLRVICVSKQNIGFSFTEDFSFSVLLLLHAGSLAHCHGSLESREHSHCKCY